MTALKRMTPEQIHEALASRLESMSGDELLQFVYDVVLYKEKIDEKEALQWCRRARYGEEES